MKVSIIDFSSKMSKLIKNITARMNKAQSKIKFEYLKEDPKKIEEHLPVLEWRIGFNILQDIQNKKDLDCNILGIVDIPLEDNWFSTTDSEICKSLISISDWNVISHLNLESYLIMEIAENLLEQLICQPNYDYTHEPPIGCISDMCVHKTDLNLKILTGYICPNCLEIIRANLDEEMINAFQALFELSRNYAIKRIQSEDPIDEDKLLFPVAVYLRKIKGEPDIKNKFVLMLNLIDILVRTTTIIISARIKEREPEYTPIFETKIPSHGDWVASLHQSSEKLKELKDKFFESFLQDFSKVYSLIEQFHLVALRNDTIGHAMSILPHEINDYYQKYYPVAISLVRQLNTFLSLKLIRVISFGHLRNIGYELICFNLNSSNPIFEKQEIRIIPKDNKREILQTENEIILFNEDLSDYISLFPYLIYTTCTTCGQPQTLIIDKKNNYIDIQMGHRVDVLNGELSKC